MPRDWGRQAVQSLEEQLSAVSSVKVETVDSQHEEDKDELQQQDAKEPQPYVRLGWTTSSSWQSGRAGPGKRALPFSRTSAPKTAGEKTSHAAE